MRALQPQYREGSPTTGLFQRADARIIGLLTAAYAFAGMFATLAQGLGEVATIYWPAAGVGVGGFLIVRRAAWPAFAAALLLVQVLYGAALGGQGSALVIEPIANLVGHALVALLIVRWGARKLDTVRTVMSFLVATLLGSVPAALLGSISSLFETTETHLATAMFTSLIGDVLGILTVTPVILLAGHVIAWRYERATEVWAAVTCTGSITVVLFTLPATDVSAHLSYLILLPLVWAAIRTRLPGSAIGVALVTFIATGTTALGRGPFADPSVTPVHRSILLHLFLGSITMATLLLASRTAESAAYQGIAEERERLLAAVSHELRTPLTPIVGFSELLLDRHNDLDPATRDGLEIILRNGHHLTALINDLLLLSSAHAARSVASGSIAPVPPEPIDCGELIERVLHEQQVDRQTDLVPPAQPVWVLANATHVERILVNLLDNATKYGRPPVTTSVHEDGDTVAIGVSDKGPGVPEWFVPHMFDAFAQEITGDLRPSIGLGLGLAICRDLARANDGDLRYDEQASGAHFVLTLPATRPDTSSTVRAPA